jgi:hypothetical protein
VRKFKTGDVVKHIPSGETWLVAWCGEVHVIPCGWPESLANVSDCELSKACTPEESIDLLRKLADGRHDSMKTSRAERELIRLRVPEYVERERKHLQSAITTAEAQITGWKQQLAALGSEVASA